MYGGECGREEGRGRVIRWRVEKREGRRERERGREEERGRGEERERERERKGGRERERRRRERERAMFPCITNSYSMLSGVDGSTL